MKRNLLYLILFALAAPAFSQNWAPINATEKFCYSSDDTLEIINNVLWVEIAQQSGNDMVYQLNKMTKPNESDYYDFAYLFNEPQFLLDQITIKEDGEWICLDTFFIPLDTLQEFSIFPLAGINDSWDFSEELQAQVTELNQIEIFGETDSIKTITLSDNSEITLSKDHGIINWRNQYQLIGIEGRDLGVLVPDFEDMYADISAGDVACIYSGSWQADETVVGWWCKERIEIESVERYSDSIVLMANVFSHCHSFWKSEDIFSFDSQRLVYYRNRYTDIYPNDTMWVDNLDFFPSGVLVISKLDFHEWGGIKKTQVHNFNEYYNMGTSFYFCPGLFSYELCVSDFNDHLMLEHSDRFGFPEYHNSGFEWGASNRLVGIIDDGVEYGEIYPLDMFVGTDQLSQETNWLVYPNPTKNQINLHSSQTGLITYQIFNYSGILMEEQTINKSLKEISISLDEFSSGVYLIKLIQNNQTEALKFLKE